MDSPKIQLKNGRRRPRRLAVRGALVLAVILATLPLAQSANALTTVFSDGFESGDLSQWTTSSGVAVQDTEVATGTFAGLATSSGTKAFLQKNLAIQYPALNLDSAINVISQGSTVNLLRLQTATGGNIATLFMSTAGNLMLRNDVGAANVWSSTIVSTGAWHQISFRVSAAGASSTVEVRYDGTKVPALSTTLNLGTNPIGRFIVGDAVTGHTFQMALDDVQAFNPDADVDAPSTPTNLHTTSVTFQDIGLAWDASTDNTGVDGYQIFRNGSLLTTVPGTQTTYDDNAVTPGTPYSYFVIAVDASNNASGPSDELDTGTSAPPPDLTVAGVESPMWQTNGTVWALAYANGAVYLGGDFTSVRPPGAALGTGEVPRNHIAAFDAATGDLLSFNHDMNLAVLELTASPDGTRIYAGGDFTTVDGIARSRLAAFDTTTGALISTWKPSSWAKVLTIAPTSTTVYIGGTFNTFMAQPRMKMAAVTASTGALLPWAPSANGTVDELAVAGGGTRVIAGGYFTTLNGVADKQIGSVDPVTGASEPWAYQLDPICTNGGPSAVRSIVAHGDNVFVGAEGTGGGCFDGTFAAKASDGTLVWRDHCLGATQAVVVIGSYLYGGSHAHNCDPVINGFQEQYPNPQHLLAESITDGAIGNWFPNTDGHSLGPRVMATNGSALYVGGEFQVVNGRPQQGITRFEFAPRAAPNKPATPNVSSVRPGVVNVNWIAPWDNDSLNLTHHLYRDGTLIATFPAAVRPMVRPVLSFEDTGLVPGSSHTYWVDASDGSLTTTSAPATVTVATANLSYSDTVLADNPKFYWRLGDLAGNVATDATGDGLTGIYQSGITKNQAGAIIGSTDRAILANGSSSGFVTSASSAPDVANLSLEIWFKTTTTRGGRIAGFGNRQTSSSTIFDRQIYMTNAGKVIFGLRNGPAFTIQTAASYNNGSWHQVVATMSGSGMALYVDGSLIGTNPNIRALNYSTGGGYWRVGGDSLSGWPSQPTSNFLSGSLDEFALYWTQLSAAQVLAHYRNAGY